MQKVRGFALGCVKLDDEPLQMVFQNQDLEPETILSIVRTWLRQQEDIYYDSFKA